jgi:hypothetical protein
MQDSPQSTGVEDLLLDVSGVPLSSPVGYAALAIDRPGYGAAEALPGGLNLDDQGRLIWSAVDTVRSRLARRLPCFSSVTHSG